MKTGKWSTSLPSLSSYPWVDENRLRAAELGWLPGDAADEFQHDEIMILP